MMYVRDGIKDNEYNRSDCPRSGWQKNWGRYCQGELYRQPRYLPAGCGDGENPVIIAGGPKWILSMNCWQWLRAAAAGAKGTGRNIFQAERPTELTRQIREIRQLFGWVMGLEGDGVDMGIAAGAINARKGNRAKPLGRP